MSKDDDEAINQLMSVAKAYIEDMWRRHGLEPRSPEAIAMMLAVVTRMFVTPRERRILRNAFAEWGFELTGGENGEAVKAIRMPRH